MKTPREILLARHRSAEPRLDALREKVLAGLVDESRPTTRPTPARRSSWSELILSLRWHLSGLGAAWLCVVVLNSEPAAGLQTAPSRAPGKPLPARQLLASFRESRRQLWELLHPPVSPPPVVPQAGATRRRDDVTNLLTLA